MSVVLANFLFEIANFIVLAGLLAWVLFKPVRAALDREREQHEKGELQLIEQHAEADRLAKEAQGLRSNVEKDAETQRSALLAAAHEEASGIQEKARQAEIADKRRREQQSASKRRIDAEALATTVGKIAAISVHKLLETIDGPSLDSGLVTAACEEIQLLPAEKRTGAIVETARPLDASASQQLEAALGQPFSTRIVESLGGGVRVTMAGGQVDASVEAMARHAAAQVGAAAMTKSHEEASNAAQA